MNEVPPVTKTRLSFQFIVIQSSQSIQWCHAGKTMLAARQVLALTLGQRRYPGGDNDAYVAIGNRLVFHRFKF